MGWGCLLLPLLLARGEDTKTKALPLAHFLYGDKENACVDIYALGEGEE